MSTIFSDISCLKKISLVGLHSELYVLSDFVKKEKDMICEQCYISHEIEALGRYLIENQLGDVFFEIQNQYLSKNLEYKSCESCKAILCESEWIYEDEYEDELFGKLGQLVAMTLPHLEQYDGSEEDMLVGAIKAVYNEPGEDTEKVLDSVGEPEMLDDIIDDEFNFISTELLPKIKDGIFSFLKEKVFSTYVDGTTYVLTDAAKEHTKEKFHNENTDNEIRKIINPLNETISYITELNETELNALKQDIINEKYIEKNCTANKLKKAFKKLYDRNYGVTIKKNKFYRARSMQTEEVKKLKVKNNICEEALTPPLGIPSQGRWNKNGKPTTLYLSDKYYNLSKEIDYDSCDQTNKMVIFVLETNRERFLMPISLLAHNSDLYKKISEPVDKKDKDYQIKYKKQYILSNLLGKIILNCGYDGIVYDPMSSNYCDSMKKNSSTSAQACYNYEPFNYAIFNHDVTNLDDFSDININGYFIYGDMC